MDHGVATPNSSHRGIVATVDGEGRNVVLMWLLDHRGCASLLVVDLETGDSHQRTIPFHPRSDSPFASMLSSKNRYYTHFASHFLEYDPATDEFTFFHETAPQMAMSMTEDDNGVIWAATYPQSGVVSYNPETGELRDYGQVYTQNWAQYPRSIAAVSYTHLVCCRTGLKYQPCRYERRECRRLICSSAEQSTYRFFTR